MGQIRNILESQKDLVLRFIKWNWTDLQFGRRIRLFKVSGFVFTTDFSSLFFLFLMLVSLRLRLFPFFYTDLSSVEYWVMAVFTTAGFALSLIAHEAIHLSTVQKLGDKPHGLFLYLFGSGTPIELTSGNRWRRVRLYSSGVLFSLFLAAIFYGLTFLSETNARGTVTIGILFHLASANLWLALFQLLPVLPLDGGRLCLDLFSRDGKLRPWVVTFFYFVGHLIAVAFLITGGYQIFRQRPVLGAWLTIIGLMLLRANFEEHDYLRLRSRLDGLPIRAFMNPMPVCIPFSISFARFSSEFLARYPFKMFPVASDDEVKGYVFRRSIYRYSRSQWHERRVSEILVPSSEENTISPNTDAGAALSLMVHTGHSRLLVTQWKRLVGIVSYGDLLKVLKSERPHLTPEKAIA